MLLLEWYRERGKFLPFDLLAVVQWDLLLLDSVDALFEGMKSSDVFFSSAKPVGPIESSWFWTSDPREKPSYDEFRRHLIRDCQYEGPPWCCEFVVACLPRSFFERWLEISRPNVGFMEYSLPTYARMFGHDFHRCAYLDTSEGWRALLSAKKEPVHLLSVIVHNLTTAKKRAFHPFVDRYPESKWDWVTQTAADPFRILSRWSERQWIVLRQLGAHLRGRLVVATGPVRRRLGLRRKNFPRLFRVG